MSNTVQDCPECYTEVRTYWPSGEQCGVIIVCGSNEPYDLEDEVWPDNGVYEATGYCPTSLDIEVETRGAGTAFLMGTIKDDATDLPVANARISWGLGGECRSSSSGFFSTIVLPGEGLVAIDDAYYQAAGHGMMPYRVQLRGAVVLTTSETRRLDIRLKRH